MTTNFTQIFYTRANHTSLSVIEKERNWTYQEFVRDANFAKTYFLNNNISKILIAIPQGYYAYVLEWGAYLAGITFCPINITNPLERMMYFIDEFKPDIIFIDDNAILQVIDCQRIDPKNLLRDTPDFVDIIQPIQTHEIAYVIFTSGSTGLPKGVMVKRTGLDNFLAWSTQEYPVGEDDIWGQYSNLGFDLSICDIFTAIIKGAALVPIASPSEKLLPGISIKNKRITFWHSVPSVVDVMSKAKHLNYTTLSSLKTITFCGERLFPSQLELLFEANPTLIIYNTYGPTEGTIFCTFVKLDKDNYKAFCANTVSIGHNIKGYDLRLNKIEEGLGEIFIVGENIAKGYLGASTNESFRTVTIDGKEENAYFTGDYGEIVDNNMYFVCRKDSQIKISGNRIDLSEIDFCLRNYGCDACMTAFHRGKIISFVVKNAFSETEIRDYLSQKLPAYYLPHLIIEKEFFPYNNSGKIDLKILLNSIEYLF